MNNKERKKLQLSLARKNIDFHFNLLESRFYPELDKFYVNEIKKFSRMFNIRLKREEKLKFCNKCSSFWNTENVWIRFNSNLCVKEYICKNCSYVRRFRYK